LLANKRVHFSIFEIPPRDRQTGGRTDRQTPMHTVSHLIKFQVVYLLFNRVNRVS